MDYDIDYDTDKIDKTVLALLTLTLHDVHEYGGRAWKGHDWDVLDRLHEQGWIGDPVSKAKSVTLTPEAMAESARLFDQLFGKSPVDMARNQEPKDEHPFLGTWHIYEMALWDEDYFNMEVQAYVEVRPDNLGNFQFGLVSGHLDGYLEGDRFVFTWAGQDEMDPMTGYGWIALQSGDQMEGLIKLHLGDRSHFKARRAR